MWFSRWMNELLSIPDENNVITESSCILADFDIMESLGSGQQSVTGFPNVDDANSYWIVRPVPETSAKQGDGIKSGRIIRLQHMKTRRWLHSHLHASPISGNLEVQMFEPDFHVQVSGLLAMEEEGLLFA
ncbi:stromal cell-derived factor 2-like protein [Tanacetum coccineum]